jgi:hypothetical protein
MEAYCVKCNAKKEMTNARLIAIKNGRQATQGNCAQCGTKMFKIGTEADMSLTGVKTYLWKDGRIVDPSK